MSQVLAWSVEESLFLIPIVVLALTGAILYRLLSDHLTVFWVKASQQLPSNRGRGKLFYGLALSGLLKPVLQEDTSPMGRVLLGVVGIVALFAAVRIVIGASAGERSISSYSERGDPGGGVKLWGGAALGLFGILAIVGAAIGDPMNVMTSWPVQAMAGFLKDLFSPLIPDSAN